MPNHVHVIFTPLPKPEGGYHAMSAIMHSLKRYTARESICCWVAKGSFGSTRTMITWYEMKQN
jgi:REP element-mobilizing transposase RayT